MNAQQAAAHLVDRHGLPTALAQHLALLVPPDVDPCDYLPAALGKPTHKSLVPYLGDSDQLILRLSVLAAEAVENLGLPRYRNKQLYEESVSHALGALCQLVKSGQINEGVRNIPAYVFVAIRRAVIKHLDWLRRFKSNTQLPLNPVDPALLNDVLDDFGLLIRGKRPESEVDFFVAVCHVYTDFYSCVRDPLDQAILELRWRYPDGLQLGCAYASDIAQALGLTTAQVVERLELLQRRYLKLVNARRRSRGHRALRPRQIHRVHRPDHCASALDLTTRAVREVA